ncbi:MULTISPECIES: hypothetical protein [Rhizobium]|uniref:hypothetical protein n=1 Tax=Rhizobium TaxID=379 RepID=UPI001FF698D2|nr:hypothetical protein [Rhizobium sp. NLR16a]
MVEEGFSGDGRQVSATAEKHGVSRSQFIAGVSWRRPAISAECGLRGSYRR